MHKHIVCLAVMVLLGLLVAGCAPVSSAQAAVYVDLNRLEDLPAPPDSDIRPLRVAVAAVISPQGSAES
ncbi:MAG: hypothetical protein D6803_05160, partial [Anaerolineae bacterium]